MTDLATALANPVGLLSGFEGHDVLRAAIEIPNAAGGLREAMKFEPREFAHDEEVTLVLKCRVKKVRFDPIKDTEALARIHVLDAIEATFIEDEAVEAALAAQRARIEEAKRLNAGTPNLDDHVDQLVAEHEAGEHAPDLVDGCPTCEEEKDLAARGQ